MKLVRSACSLGVGAGGYVAAIEWSSVHVLRPRASTSGGQSLGCGGGAAEALREDLVCAAHEAKEVHERQLEGEEERLVRCEDEGLSVSVRRSETYGLPSLPRTTPFGNFFGGSVVVAPAGVVAAPS